VAEVAGYLRISQRQVRGLIAQGEISVTRFGRAVRIHERDMLAYVVARGRLLNCHHVAYQVTEKKHTSSLS